MKEKFYIHLAVIATIGVTACTASKVSTTSKDAPAPKVSEACANSSYTYAEDVKQIIDKNCAGSCHSAEKKASGIDLSTYENVKAEANKERFMMSLKHEGAYTPMPKKSPKLSDSTLNVLSCWIENGCK